MKTKLKVNPLQEFPFIPAKICGGQKPTESFPAVFGHLWRKIPPETFPELKNEKKIFAAVF
jgi:hypothetical protein